MGQGLGDVAETPVPSSLPWPPPSCSARFTLMPGTAGPFSSPTTSASRRDRSTAVSSAILTLTHVGLALVLVLAGFAVISRAFAQGGRTPQFEIASGAMVAMIGAFLLWRSLSSEHRAAPEAARRSLS
jgi:hypothetical protein